MGTNSSTLRSVESLGDTLRSIESRLFDIEDIALHHETGIFSNNTCVVSGKVILGNPNIRLTIGPILGLVGTSFFRVLVETNSSGPLTFNVFKCIPGIPHRRRFVSTININAVEGSPSVIMVSNLDPGIEYWGFLGGIHPDEIHNNVVQVHTLSTDIENVQAFACKSINNVSTFEDSRVQMQLLSAVSCNNGPSWVFNLGNLLRLQPIFWRSITQLLSSNNCEENGMSDWELRLSEFERCVRQEYRNALSSSLVQQLGKRCCCIFLADENESFGSHLISISELYGSTESSSSILGRNDSPKVSLFGSSQRDKTLSELQALPKVTEHTSEVVDHILAAVARILRRYNWVYCRQLWDESIENYLQEDSRKELLMRQVIHTTRQIQVKSCIRGRLKSAAMQIPSNEEKCALLDKDINAFHEDLRKLATAAGDLNLQMVHPSSVSLVNCGSTFMILMDTCWTHIASDGSIDRMLESMRIDEVTSAQIGEFFSTSKLDGQNKELSNTRMGLLISSGFLGPTHGSLPSRGLVNADDLVSILQYMARWQQEDDRRVAVLLESSNSQSCASFRISPKITDDEAHDVWNKDRCSFTGLLCGSTVNTIERFDSRPFMQLQKGEFAADFRSENQLFEHHDVQLCLRPCIWHFSYRAAAVMSTASYSYAQPAQLILSSIVQPDYSLESIIVGPIVSNVTPHSATVLLEGSVSNMCVIKCIEASSGVEFVCSNFMRKHEPTFFHFEGLSPNRHYQLTIADSPTICGSFSTLLTVPSDEMPDPFHRARVREAVGADESEGTSGESFRILIIGIMSTSEDKPAILQSSLSDIRGMHDLQDLLSLPWSGFDLVLHFGGISNWRAALDTAISDLSLLEQLNKNSMQQEVGGLQAKVEGYFRESIRSFLGANSHVRSLLCNGSHRFVSDPVVELLGGMNAPSLSVLSRDLSPFCLDTLLAAVRRAHALYMEPQSTICWIIQGPCCIYNMHLQLRCGGEYTNAFNCIGRDSLDKLDSVLTALPTSIHTLALVCSLPIVPAQRLYSSYSDLRFSHLDTVGILDVVWKWARESSSRQAVLVGSEAGRSRRLTISIRAGDVMTRKLSQICIGSRPDMETHARHPEESYDLVSKMWSDVVFSVSPEPDEGSGTVGVVEVPMVSLPDSHASFQWLTQDDMRSRSMAIADDCCASTRIQVDPVLNKLLDIAGESYSNAEFEAALESESDAFAAAVGFASSLPVPSRCSAIGFLQRVGGVVSTNFSPGIRNIVHQPTAVSAALAWKQFTSEQLRSGRSWSDCLVALHQDATVLVSLLKAMFSLQLKLQLLSWEAGCLD